MYKNMNQVTDEQSMYIQEALKRTLKTDRAPSFNNRPLKTIPVPRNSEGKVTSKKFASW